MWLDNVDLWAGYGLDWHLAIAAETAPRVLPNRASRRSTRSDGRHSDEAVAGDQPCELRLGQPLRPGRTARKDHEARLRARVPHSDLDVVGYVVAELAQDGPRLADDARAVALALVPGR